MEREHPSFSVIVPTYRRPRQLAACLHALTELDYPRDHFEVLVIDDGSGDPPWDVVASYRGRCQVALLTQAHAGPAAARNTGAGHARSDFLAFIDDDCAADSGWLRAFAGCLAAAPDYLVGGRTVNALVNSPCSTASQLLIDYLYGYYDGSPGRPRFFASCNMAVPAERFRAVGGFKTTYPRAAAEDRELCDRWLHCGYGMAYAPEAVVSHSHILTMRSFCRQHFNYGRGAFLFHQDQSRRAPGGFRPEPLSFYFNLLRYPFSRAHGWPALWLSGLLALSQGANAMGFFWETLFRSPVGPLGAANDS